MIRLPFVRRSALDEARDVAKRAVERADRLEIETLHLYNKIADLRRLLRAVGKSER